VPAYGPQNDVTLKMPAFEWVHVQLHQQKGMISLSPPTICNSATEGTETILLFVLGCLFPAWFAWFAWIFGALCWMTTFTRVWSGYLTLKSLQRQ
ncbi:hypothetical protein OZG91_13115, partial [Escherichia coli]|nr:hypothetical protein [Escherichia coli]MCZ0254079.1 hypothetical protein [Escherichia coli]MCZ0317299.1 hypothetical protein [Escherichia coli]MCZ0398588.1 hypothetical protein [Escherichia coli]MCZ0407706.1 hypothetical protein [Escherichia coli]